MGAEEGLSRFFFISRGLTREEETCYHPIIPHERKIIMDFEAQLRAFSPECEQEARDRQLMLSLLASAPDLYTRQNETAHLTASAWLVNSSRTKVLMAYHNIYQSFAWTGGHADGETDLLSVALREAREETGLLSVRPVTEALFSLEILTVNGHEKRGAYVPSHLHLNATYLLEADETAPLRVKPDENSAVRWLTLEESETLPTEPWMVERVYRKLNRKLRRML